MSATALLLCCVVSVQADAMSFVSDAVFNGLQHDAAPAGLVTNMLNHEGDFVAKCLLCKATREGMHRHVAAGCRRPGTTLSGELVQRLNDNDAKIRQNALRELVSGYIDTAFAESKLPPDQVLALQTELARERQQSMGIKGDKLEFCPSCDGACCQLAPAAEVVWGPAAGAVQSRLTLVTARPQVGKPLRLRLELKNSGLAEYGYDPQQASCNGSLHVAGPDGKAIPYSSLSFQTMGQRHAVPAGGKVVVFADLDVAPQYLIDRSGEYQFQFVGRGGIPSSNTLAVKVAGGQLTDKDRLFAAVVNTAPVGWRVARFQNSISWLHTPTNLKVDASSVTLFFTKDAKPGKVQPPATELGATTLGHAWLQTTGPTEWPDRETVIKTALAPFKK